MATSTRSKSLLWTAAGAGLLLFARSADVRHIQLQGKIALDHRWFTRPRTFAGAALGIRRRAVAICARDEEDLEQARRGHTGTCVL